MGATVFSNKDIWNMKYIKGYSIYIITILQLLSLSSIEASTGSTPSFTSTDSIRYFYDGDSDGKGDIDSMVVACEAPAGFVTDATDCDDSDPSNANCITYVVNTTDDNDDGVCDDKHCSLREALEYGNGSPKFIFFQIQNIDTAVIYPINFFASELNKSINIDARYSESSIVLDGTNHEFGSCFTVVRGVLNLNNLIFQNWGKYAIEGFDSKIEIEKCSFWDNEYCVISWRNDIEFSNNIIGRNENKTKSFVVPTFAQRGGLMFSNKIGLDFRGYGSKFIITNNDFICNTRAVQFSSELDVQHSKFEGNRFIYNDIGISELGTKFKLKTPVISKISSNSINGVSDANINIKIYDAIYDKTASGWPQGYNLIGTTQSDNNGTWNIELSNAIKLGIRIVAQASDNNGNVSLFSDIEIINYCSIPNQVNFDLEDITIFLSEDFKYKIPSYFSDNCISHRWYFLGGNQGLYINNKNDGSVILRNNNQRPAGLIYECIDSLGCLSTFYFTVRVENSSCDNFVKNDSIYYVVNNKDSGFGSINDAINCANNTEQIIKIMFDSILIEENEIIIKSQLSVIEKSFLEIDGALRDSKITLINESNEDIDGINSRLNSNIDIKNLRLEGFERAVYFEAVDKISVNGVHFEKNALGIAMRQTNGTIRTNSFVDNSTGIDMGIDNELSIVDNYFELNDRAIYTPIYATSESINDYSPSNQRNNRYVNNALANNWYWPFHELRTELIIQFQKGYQIFGKSDLSESIEIYLNENVSSGIECQGDIKLGETTSDSIGNWKFLLPKSITANDKITAISHSAKNISSFFSPCFLVIPDNCNLSTTLPINLDPCSQIGSVMDMTQLSDSEVDIFSEGCGDTYAGNDVWYTVTIPPTGNVLIRTNSENTIHPVIQVYAGDCDGLIPISCQVLDSLPYSMILEDYTPGNTVYLRAWDQNNTVVDSDETALLHLTAHELDANPDNWVICDEQSNLLDNPTVISRKDANTFIVEYESATSTAEIEQASQEFLAEGLTLSDECLCNETPLQLWGASNPIEMEGLKRRSRIKTRVDTSNYNYIFENIEFQVNSYAIGQQYETDVSMDAAGNFVMVWVDEQRRHNYGRYYSSSGNPLVPEFRIGASDQTQDDTRVLMLDESRFVAVWRQKEAGKFSIWARTFEWTGSEVVKGDIIPISDNALQSSFISNEKKSVAINGSHCDVAWDRDTTIGIVWSAGGDLFYQSYDLDLTPLFDTREIGEDIRTHVLPYPSLDMNQQGDIAITWIGSDKDGDGIFCQKVQKNGVPSSEAFSANVVQENNQSHPSISLFNDGSYIVSWQSEDQVSGDAGYDVYARRFDSENQALGEETLINQYIMEDQKTPSVTTFDDGSYYISWSSYGQDGYEEGIYGRVYDKNGNPVNDEFQVNVFTDPEQEKPRTSDNGENLFITAWEDGGNDGSYKGIFAQRYEILDRGGMKTYYPIGTATPSTLLGDFAKYPDHYYVPQTADNVVRVAIIDSGVDDGHPAISEALWANDFTSACLIDDVIGYDFINDLGDPIDLDGHGTQVTGIITRDFNPNVRLETMNLKFYERGRATVFDAICAIYYAVDHGANVINLSWGFEASEEPLILKKALQYASDRDVIIVTTAGNTSKNLDRINKYPANLDIENMITVTSYQYNEDTDEKKLANYACYGAENVDIAAIGFVEAPSLGDTILQTAGTSLAAPFVSRTAATIKGMYPSMTADEITDCILSTAVSEASLEGRIRTGGTLNHEGALACAFQKFMTTAVDEVGSTESSLTLYPNPSQDGFFQIQTDEEIEALWIFDMHGRLVRKSTSVKNRIQVEENGIYFVRCLTSDGKWITRELVNVK